MNMYSYEWEAYYKLIEEKGKHKDDIYLKLRGAIGLDDEGIGNLLESLDKYIDSKIKLNSFLDRVHDRKMEE